MTLTMRFARASLWMESNNVKGHMCFGVCLLPTTLSEWPCMDIELQGMDVLVFFFSIAFFFSFTLHPLHTPHPPVDN